MVYDVDMPDNENELVEDIYEQNFKESNIDLETFKAEFEYVYKYKKRDTKDTRVSLVIQCSAKVRNLIRTRGKIYIGW